MADVFDPKTAKLRIQRSKLRGLERYVARCILDYWSQESSMPFPSYDELAEWSGFGRRAVIDAIKGLVAARAIRIECKRPMKRVNGRLQVVRNAKPTNHYDLSGLMTLPVRERYRCTSDTSAADAPVQKNPPTSAPGALEPVHEGNSKGSREGIQEGIQRGSALTSSRRKPKKPLPKDWQPNDLHRQRAKERALDIELVAEKFRNHALANDRRQVDWNAAFTTWILSERGPHKAKGSVPDQQDGVASNVVTGSVFG